MFDAFRTSAHLVPVSLMLASGAFFMIVSFILTDDFRETGELDTYLRLRFTEKFRGIFLWTISGFLISLALSYVLFVFQHTGMALFFLAGGILLTVYFLKERIEIFLQEYRRAIRYVSAPSVNGAVRKIELRSDDITLRITLREARSTVESEFDFADYHDLRADLFVGRPIRLYYRVVQIGTETVIDVQEILFLRKEETC